MPPLCLPLDVDGTGVYHPLNNGNILFSAWRMNVPETKHNDRRQYPRKLVEKPLVVLFDFAGRGAAREALTVDLSQKGARIRTDLELISGQSVDLLAKDSINTVPSQVVWVGNPGPDRVREIGLQFLHGALFA